MIKTDSTQAAIIAALRAAGATVEMIQSATGRPGIPDLLCGRRGVTYLLEVKTIEGKRKPKAARCSPEQIKWHAAWGGRPVTVVTTPEEALRAIGLQP
jgi:Holliday junction resolvase